ncbi:glycoprotease [Fomitopsis betulina]|nr:glycoprotease [Fomitopsis betulina]
MFGLKNTVPRSIASALKHKPVPSWNPKQAFGKDVISVLAVETSADDTCAAVVTSDRRILSNVVIRQDELPLGGIQPYVAIEAHQRNLPTAISRALEEARIRLQDVDGIAFTRGPGMSGCLSVGSNAMKTLASVLKKPMIGVHHMHAHALTPFLTEPADSQPSYPFLSLLLSGGHSLILLALSPREFQILGSSRDEPVGRTFDKVARRIGIPWGDRGLGASLEEYVRKGPPEGYDVSGGYEIPHYATPMLGTFQLAFASYHSATEQFMTARNGEIDEHTRYAVASAFQTAIAKQLGYKVRKALQHCKSKRIPIGHVVAGGGVASNMFLRENLRSSLDEQGLKSVELVYPPPSLCTDNAAMVAWAAMGPLTAGQTDPPETELVPKWSIEDLDTVSDKGPLPKWQEMEPHTVSSLT